MEPQPSRNGFRTVNRGLVSVIIAGVCVIGALLFRPLIQESREQTEQIAKLQSELTRERALHARSAREEELLKNDPAYIELIARDRLDVMKPGETIIHLETKKPK